MLGEMEQDGLGTVVPYSTSNGSQLLFNKKPYGDLTEEQKLNINEADYTDAYNAAMPKRISQLMIATVDRYMILPPTPSLGTPSTPSQSQSLGTPSTPSQPLSLGTPSTPSQSQSIQATQDGEPLGFELGNNFLSENSYPN